jgi:hypothetical protein
MIWPLSRGQLRGRKEEISNLDASTAKLSQYEEGTDVYVYEYVFKRIDGKWRLVEYDDDTL